MANIFRRQPQIGGDTNAWGTYLNAIINDATGIYSSYLYNDSGTLKLSKGLIGIDNDTNIGLATIDTITTITLTGTAGIWQKIELSVSGASVTLAATDIAGETDPDVVPSGFTGAYDPEKGGYYITSSKRCIGIVFVDGGGILGEIINAGIDYLTTLTTRNLVAKEVTIEDIIAENLTIDYINLQYQIIGGAKKAENTVSGLHGTYTLNEAFDILSPFIPNVNDSIQTIGSVASPGIFFLVVSKAVRTGANQVTLYGNLIASSDNYGYAMDNGSATTAKFSICW